MSTKPAPRKKAIRKVPKVKAYTLTAKVAPATLARATFNAAAATYDQHAETLSLLYTIQQTLDTRLTHASEVQASREQLVAMATHNRRLIEEKQHLGERIRVLENQAKTCSFCCRGV